MNHFAAKITESGMVMQLSVGEMMDLISTSNLKFHPEATKVNSKIWRPCNCYDKRETAMKCPLNVSMFMAA